MDLIENIHIKNITDILKNIGERVEGNLLCDIYPDNWTYSRNISKIKNLQFMCKDKTKIIEIGAKIPYHFQIHYLYHYRLTFLSSNISYKIKKIFINIL